jgi:Ca2+-binding EF-hand superfamily protein
LAEEEVPAEKTINQLSIFIEDNGLTKAELFHRIDVNHNGLIDKGELFEGLKGLGIGVGLVGKVLAVFDRDASGEIALEEWLSILGEDLEMEEVE